MPKVGPYYLYMLDFKKEKEAELGRNLSMAQVSGMASDSWNNMSEGDKAYYKEKAKGGDMRLAKRPSGSVGGSSGGGIKFTSQGVPVDAYERQQKEQKHADEIMRRRIGTLIQNVPLMTDFLTHPLYLMYGNYFYKNDKTDEFSPAELAMIKFTFRDGILKRLHTYISPEKIALGFAYTAKAHTESTHRLPTPTDAYGEKNLSKVWCKIHKFMDLDKEDKAFDGGKPMVFTFTDSYASEANQIDVLKSFMKQFVGDDKPLPIDLYPLTRLFYTLRKELAARDRVDDVPSEKFCEMFLSNDPYETHAGISCAYHEDIDATRHCALSRVVRWTFLLADHFCEPLGVQLIAGTHLPQNADVPSSLSVKTSSEDESVEKPEKTTTDSDVDSKSQDYSLTRKAHRDVRCSNSTLNYEIQSIRTSSTASNAASSEDRKKNRPSRSALIANTIHSQPNSSTFYNA